jgi:hypothetical protein
MGLFRRWAKQPFRDEPPKAFGKLGKALLPERREFPRHFLFFREPFAAQGLQVESVEIGG